MNARGERHLATRRDNTYPRLTEARCCCHPKTRLCCTWCHLIHADLDRRVDEERSPIYHHADGDSDQREHAVGRRIMRASLNPVEYQWIPFDVGCATAAPSLSPGDCAYTVTGRRSGCPPSGCCSNKRSISSAGVWNPSCLRGRSLSCCETHSRSVFEYSPRSEPLAKY